MNQKDSGAHARFDEMLARALNGKLIVCDGGWGTELQHRGLPFGDCAEEWNITRPTEPQEVAAAYALAGAEICLTNTFGANKYRLQRHGLASKLNEINRSGAELSVKGVAVRPGTLVFGSVGPTGEYIQPDGMLSFKELRAAFAEQMRPLRDGGVSGFMVETMYEKHEALAAIEAAAEIGLPCIASATFDATDSGYRTMQGDTLEEITRALDQSTAAVIGSNCGTGIRDMVAIAKQMRNFTSKPLIIRANAGLPETRNGKVVYRETADEMASHIAELYANGVRFIGGCCGTTPEHVVAFGKARNQINGA